MYPFNVRVYGLLLENNKVLVSDEYINGYEMTKFPGGGLEFGEGTIEALKREFMEELNTKIEILQHFYTTDFFVQSAFNKSQVVSIYYLVKPLQVINYPISDSVQAFNFNATTNQQFLRWVALSEISEKHFTFDADKKVGELLKKIR